MPSAVSAPGRIGPFGCMATSTWEVRASFKGLYHTRKQVRSQPVQGFLTKEAGLRAPLINAPHSFWIKDLCLCRIPFSFSGIGEPAWFFMFARQTHPRRLQP